MIEASTLTHFIALMDQRIPAKLLGTAMVSVMRPGRVDIELYGVSATIGMYHPARKEFTVYSLDIPSLIPVAQHERKWLADELTAIGVNWVPTCGYKEWAHFRDGGVAALAAYKLGAAI